MIEKVLTRYGPVIELFEVEGTRERRIVIGYKTGGTKQFFGALSDLYHFYGLYSKRKYVEQFANGVTIICTFSLLASLHMLMLPYSTIPQSPSQYQPRPNRTLNPSSGQRSLPPFHHSTEPFLLPFPLGSRTRRPGSDLRLLWPNLRSTLL